MSSDLHASSPHFSISSTRILGNKCKKSCWNQVTSCAFPFRLCSPFSPRTAVPGDWHVLGHGRRRARLSPSASSPNGGRAGVPSCLGNTRVVWPLCSSPRRGGSGWGGLAWWLIIPCSRLLERFKYVKRVVSLLGTVTNHIFGTPAAQCGTLAGLTK